MTKVPDEVAVRGVARDDNVRQAGDHQTYDVARGAGSAGARVGVIEPCLLV